MATKGTIRLLEERGYILKNGAFQTQSTLPRRLFAVLVRKDLTFVVPFVRHLVTRDDETIVETLADAADMEAADQFHKDMGDLNT